MAKKPVASLDAMMEEQPAAQPAAVVQPEMKRTADEKKETAQYQKVGVLMLPAAIRQFDELKLDQKRPGRRANIGPELLHEALNMLFVKYGKRPIPLPVEKSRQGGKNP